MARAIEKIEGEGEGEAGAAERGDRGGDAVDDPRRTRLDESVAATAASLTAALSATDGRGRDGSALAGGTVVPPALTDATVLARPPYAHVRALVEVFAERRPSLGWREFLLAEERNGEEDEKDDKGRGEGSSKREKLAFLAKLLSVVSIVAGRRHDVYVSPSNVLCGREVFATHDFLRALAESTQATDEAMARAVRSVAEEGHAACYKRGVRARRGFVGLQAAFRGRMARRKLEGAQQVDAKNGAGALPGSRPKALPSKSKKSEEEPLQESYQAVLTRKAEVEEELQAAEAKLKRENDKLIRMLNLGAAHKTRSRVVPCAGAPRPPLSAPIVGSVDAPNPRAYQVDEAFGDKITNFAERQRSMKQRERRMEEREAKLKQRFARSKHREDELKLQEERLSDLAGKVRNQKMHLKERRMELERAKALEEPERAPPETSRPCPLCTEKKIQTREMRSKVRQRARRLGQREAMVARAAQELRRRERELELRERAMAEEMEQQSTVEELIVEYSREEPRPLSGDSSWRREVDGESTSNSESLPNVRDAASRKKGAKKRRRRGPRDEPTPDNSPPEETLSHGDETAIDRESSMRSSFGEIIPTIVEETPAEEQEEQSMADDGDGEGKELESHPVVKDLELMDDAGKGLKRSDANIVPTNIKKARQHLGIAKKSRKDTLPRRASGRKSQHEKAAEARPERRVSRPPSPPKRHVFNFEKRDSQEDGRNGVRLRSGSRPLPPPPGVVEGARRTSRGVDGRAKAPSVSSHRREKHDDWISSFDAQMKCAMHRLKELV